MPAIVLFVALLLLAAPSESVTTHVHVSFSGSTSDLRDATGVSSFFSVGDPVSGTIDVEVDAGAEDEFEGITWLGSYRAY